MVSKKSLKNQSLFEQSENPHENEVNRYDKIEDLGIDQDQDACNDREDGAGHRVYQHLFFSLFESLSPLYHVGHEK